MGYLQGLYENDKQFACIANDRDFAAMLQARGFYVFIHEGPVYGASTDAYMGTSYEVKKATVEASEAATWEGYKDDQGEYSAYTLMPVMEDANPEASDRYTEDAFHAMPFSDNEDIPF
jgi:hypothetical protein